MDVFNINEWYIHLKNIEEFNWKFPDDRKKLVKDGYDYLPIIRCLKVGTFLENAPIIGVTIKLEDKEHKITFFLYNIIDEILQTINVHSSTTERDLIYEYMLSFLYSKDAVNSLIDLKNSQHYPMDWLKTENSRIEEAYFLNKDVIQSFNQLTMLMLFWKGKYDQLDYQYKQLKGDIK